MKAILWTTTNFVEGGCSLQSFFSVKERLINEAKDIDKQRG